MNPKYFGDSYDIVKRFFCSEIARLGYSIVVDPMFTGDWRDTKGDFLRFIGASLPAAVPNHLHRIALFLDPDTGVSRKSSKQHLSLTQLAEAALEHNLVFAFDQSFSRQQDPNLVMQEKMSLLQGRGCHAMYYNSHARFLFVSTEEQQIIELRSHLVSLGLPPSRFIANETRFHKALDGTGR